MMKKKLLIVLSCVTAAGLGVTGGAALAAVSVVVSPAGVSPADGVPNTPAPVPEYKVNALGQTFGSALDAISPETEPDLIQAVARNGKIGYVRKVDLDRANGTEAAATFKTPEEAVRWQETEGLADREINVYAMDGVSVIGTFIVAGYSTQQQSAAADPER